MTPPGGAAPRLEFVLGRADEVRAEVYVRLVGGADDATVAGTLAGPRCLLAATLPATAPLRALAGEGPAAARAIVTEPSFWTPEVPNLYELVAEATTPAGVQAAFHRLVGLRRLGIRGRSIWLDGRRWVPRGRVASVASFDPARYRAESLAAVITDPTNEACTAADAAGVAIVAHCVDERDPASSVARVTELAQHPAVVMAVIPHRHVAAVVGSRSTGTMLVAIEVDAGVPPPPTVPPGVDCLVARLVHDAVPMIAWRDDVPPLPVVAWREDMGEGRRPCEVLQADLAGWATTGDRRPTWDWAGYIVT